VEQATAHIEGVERDVLVDALKEELDDYLLYGYDNVVIFFIERYYLRVNSNLMTAAILNFLGPDKCTVELTSGGGGQGLLGITWGSELSGNGKVLDLIEDLCEERGWQLSVDEEKEE
jgi:hypothetical protein